MEALVGVTAMLSRVALLTVSVTPGLVTVPQVAVIVVVPSARPVANPEVLMVAVAVVEEFHVSVVRVFMLPSLYVPVAVYCWVPPMPMVAVAGVTAMLVRVGAAVTFRIAVPVIVPELAVIMDVPAATPVASPPGLLIVAVAGVPELQVTREVITTVLPLLYVPVATYCCVPPTAMLAVAGVTAIEVSVVLLLLPQAANENARTITVAKSAPARANFRALGILAVFCVRDPEL